MRHIRKIKSRFAAIIPKNLSNKNLVRDREPITNGYKLSRI